MTSAAPVRLDVEDGPSLRTVFLESAARWPDRPALVVQGRTLSYRECEETARRWAGAIVARLGRAPRRVGVFALRTPSAYVGTLAALFAGAAFVPLNRRFPTDRTATMARLAELDAIVVDEASAAQLETVLAALPVRPLVIAPDAPETRGTVLGADALAGEPLDALPPVLADDLAYLLFTSGTTGVPKGVGVTHANVLHFLAVMSERYRLAETDRASQTFDPTFDLSVFDLFMTWRAGAALHVLQQLDLLAPARFVARHELTVWFSVPSVAALMRKSGSLKPDALPSLRWSLFCGEPLPRATAEAWQAAAPNSIVENLYGPTELTIACFTYRWDPARSAAESENDVVPIGRPLPGLGALVRASEPEDAAAGVGELLVCGPQTVPGYWRDPERTAQRFVELDVGDGFTKRFYATGDRVRTGRDGAPYTFLGRTDHQIKVSGYRIELGEIEAVLLREPDVVSAAAIGWPIVDGNVQGIIAFVIPRAPLDTAELRTRLRLSLPEYMVPSAVHARDEFPLNSNGKIDRAALAASLAAALAERA